MSQGHEQAPRPPEEQEYKVDTFIGRIDLHHRALTGEHVYHSGLLRDHTYVEVCPELEPSIAKQVADELSEYIGGADVIPMGKLEAGAFGTIFAVQPDIAAIPEAAPILGIEVAEKILPELGVIALRAGHVSDLGLELEEAYQSVRSNPDWMPYQIRNAQNEVRKKYGQRELGLYEW
ncbi:MAG TPA: hypothetical protein VK983_03225 [Candidatus Limnocylindrales bacterium]|nr:hypothetical protein [Candidatus Limnocylindrales bacterium]